MVDASIINEWMKKAAEDLDFAESSLHDGSEFYAQICFHFQQSAEKYLKTFIISRQLPFVDDFSEIASNRQRSMGRILLRRASPDL